MSDSYKKTSCYPCWSTHDGLELVGPKYFGYDVDFIAVEKR
jgi:uncharacterized protein